MQQQTNTTPWPEGGGPDDRIIRLPEVLHLTGLGKRTVYKMMRAVNAAGEPAPEFPLPVELCKNSVGWWMSEVVWWIDNRPRRRYHARVGVAQGVAAKVSA